MSVQFNDNSAAVKSQMAQNITRALTAMGEVGLEMVIDTMNTGYGKPIYLTGDLQREMAKEIDVGEQTVTWGNPLNYAVPVHEGTAKMAGRPYLRDGILGHKDELRDVAAEEIKRGF